MWVSYIFLTTSLTVNASISGLLAARVCSDHFAHVVIIDPELGEVERTKASTRIAQYDSLHGENDNQHRSTVGQA